MSSKHAGQLASIVLVYMLLAVFFVGCFFLSDFFKPPGFFIVLFLCMFFLSALNVLISTIYHFTI